MADRNLEDGKNFGKGVVYLDFSFIPNGTGQPATTSFRGTSGVASLTRTGVGTFTLTLKDKYRYVISKGCDLEETAGGDGAYASLGAPANEGTTTPITVPVYTQAAAGTKTDYTGRRVSVNLALKNSTVGD